MAGKSRRVASRQGELSRRRKRAQRGPSGIPAGRAAGPTGGGTATAEAVAVGAAAGTADSAPGATAAAPAAPAAAGRSRAAQARGTGRVRGERPAAYNYVGAELRRIGILSMVALGALIGLTFVL